MSTYFTIGEVSKLFNLPIKTLRYYDEKGVLKPAYINPSTNYRYYSREQFISIDIIKYCKLIGMSLEEIKELINSDSSIEIMINNMNKQSELLKRKIKELTDVKTYLDDIKNSVEEILEYEINKVIIRRNKERKNIRFDLEYDKVEELELYLRKVILYLEERYNDVYPLLGVIAPYNNVKNRGEIKYSCVCDFTDRGIKNKESNNLNGVEIITPGGNYITIFFDDNWENINKYYYKIMDYIEENNIEVEGDFNEVWTMPRVDSNGKEKTFGYIEILIKNNDK
ncbi:MerR family transcriptional regulator [Romboutsia ilealis]|uniref:MerR family transcriptional regulator n=1 Tax=Romboutsia faecis TaxID=2764597 RepID=A0ABR7JQY3_9FIRM|nr:helix-turn-helix domain-containing protein [Romboutsia faecis]MBC5997330.1 MerR family transcriptional regulator [Romboutsia faecis]MRN23612.1 MerR family transcriptional regulator [Romboutsia ilealis]